MIWLVVGRYGEQLYEKEKERRRSSISQRNLLELQAADHSSAADEAGEGKQQEAKE